MRKPRAVGAGLSGASEENLTTSAHTIRQVDEIRVGHRHRRDLGDIDGLAHSIDEIGLLHPIVVKPDGELIAGGRRFQAVQLLGWKHVPVNVVDIDSISRGEFAENSQRKDFTLSEAVAIKRTLEPIERQKAQERMVAGRPSEKFSKGRALDKVGIFVGKHRTTIAKAEAIVAAAEAEPEKFGKLVEQMDRKGGVDGIYKRLQNIKHAEVIRAEPPPLPNKGPYRVAVCDVPWPFEPEDDDPDKAAHRGAWPYPTMSLDEIRKLAVSAIMHADAILWFWVTNFHMRYAFEILEAWGFHQTPTILTWVKDRANGQAKHLWGQTEHCIKAVRGELTLLQPDAGTALHAPVRGHSRKPVEFFDLVERLHPAPRYASLFAGSYQHNDKWDCHGKPHEAEA
jgi:N6-adenosine-specific RNA methylase IME4